MIDCSGGETLQFSGMREGALDKGMKLRSPSQSGKLEILDGGKVSPASSDLGQATCPF